MSVFKYLDLSTAHITQKDAETITKDLNAGEDRRLIGCDRPFGFWLHVCAEPDGSELHKAQLAEFKRLGLSKSFLKCYERARKLGCYWMLFDCDAEEEEGLDVHEW